MIEYENLHLTNLPFIDEFKAVFDEVLKNGRFVLGSKLEEFETQFANYIGAKNCIGVASGTDAILIAIKTLDIPKGAEIIVPDNSFIGTALAVIHAGCTPVLATPNSTTYNLDLDGIQKSLTPKTRAIIAVHMYGKCCDMDTINEFALAHNLYVIEDAAHAHGAMYKGRQAGTLSHIAAFSFYPTKILGALGDGGAITTNDSNLASKAKKYRNYGFAEKNSSELNGYNSRLDELQAAFLSVKLKHIDKIIAHKRHLANIYLRELKSDFVLPAVHPDYFDVYYAFVVRHPQREKVLDTLKKNKIGYHIHYPKWISEQAIFGNKFSPKDYFSLPLGYFHSERDIENVSNVANSITF